MLPTLNTPDYSDCALSMAYQAPAQEHDYSADRAYAQGTDATWTPTEYCGNAALQVLNWADWHLATAADQESNAYETFYHAALGYGFYAAANVFVTLGEFVAD